MVKYTLYCKNGSLFKTGPHFLLFGEWLPYWSRDYTILCHGTLSDEEYRQFSSQKYINVYQNNKNTIMSLFNEYNEKYLQRKGGKIDIMRYAGCLQYAYHDFYIGEVRVK